MRRSAMRAAAIAALICALVGGVPPAQAAQPLPVSAIGQAQGEIRASEQRLARQAAAAMAGFRSSVRSSLADYLNRYGSRLSADERQRMSDLAQQADRDLAGLVTRTRQVARLTDRGKRAQASRTAAQAVSAYQQSQAKALATLQQVQPILQPKLGLLEALQAKADMDAQLQQFSEVGALIEATDRALRASEATSARDL